jgi:CPA2 family monovalent cation:H+ antiporter-2
MAYFGHLDKLPVLESLKVDEASSVIITVSDTHMKRLICEAVLKFHKEANILLKIESLDEKALLKDLNIKKFVHAHFEVGRLLVEEALVKLENK